MHWRERGFLTISHRELCPSCPVDEVLWWRTYIAPTECMPYGKTLSGLKIIGINKKPNHGWADPGGRMLCGWYFGVAVRLPWGHQEV